MDVSLPPDEVSQVSQITSLISSELGSPFVETKRLCLFHEVLPLTSRLNKKFDSFPLLLTRIEVHKSSECFNLRNYENLMVLGWGVWCKIVWHLNCLSTCSWLHLHLDLKVRFQNFLSPMIIVYLLVCSLDSLAFTTVLVDLVAEITWNISYLFNTCNFAILIPKPFI